MELAIRVKERVQSSPRLMTVVQTARSLRHRAPLAVPPGDDASPIPRLAPLEARRAAIWGRVPRTLPGIDLDDAGQLALLDALAPYLNDFNALLATDPAPRRYASGLRSNRALTPFAKADAAILYALIRHLRPTRILGVGAGYAASVILDTNTRHFADRIACAFVEPHPRELRTALHPGDLAKIELIRQPVGALDPALFATLQANDILFVDGGHVLKTGGDLNALLFAILPHLASGVYVHFHEIRYPFEYAESEVAIGRAWNEAYALRAFLQYNRAFTIACFVAYLDRFHRNRLTDYMPGTAFSQGTSLWLRRASAGIISPQAE